MLWLFLMKTTIPERDLKTGRLLPGAKIALKHGAYADKIFSNIRRRVRKMKLEWIANLGPRQKDLTMSQKVLIDRSCFLLERIISLEDWSHTHKGCRPLADALRDNYLSWVSNLRATLRELGIDKRVDGAGMTEKEYLDSIDTEEEGPQSGTEGE